ncbi:MAG: stage III sporulation protein AB [Clostridia bacterium]|nr:stage III sporulation protein AB [Clostridia bacterium]
MTGWLGAVLICLSGLGLGQLFAQGTRQRVRELEAWRTALLALASEVDFAAVPLGRALERAAAGARGGCRRALAAAAEALLREGCDAEAAWGRALALARAESPLGAEDLLPLADLAPALGRTGRADQLQHIAHSAGRIEARLASLREAAERDARLFAYLFALGALALAVALG